MNTLSPPNDSMSNRENRLERYALLLLFLIIVIRNAWVSDDAYITFRTIENFLSGYGLTYNPYVRVQVYTHPAWMFLLSGIYFLERLFIPAAPNALYFIAVFVSALLSFLTLVFIMKAIARDDLPASIFVFSAFILSRAFIDYSTSGLENPLSHLLLVLFAWVYIKTPEKIFLLTLIASLLLLSRLDLILMVLPALLHAVWLNWKRLQTLRELALGTVPILAWELFSVFYYGFPFPNTAYAKLNTGVEGYLLIQQGLDYLLNSLHWDPLTLFIVIFAGVAVFTSSAQLQGDRKRSLLFAGIVLYILYVVKIGGDFMSGRFLTAPFLVSVIVLARASLPGKILWLIAGITMLLGIFSIRSTLLEPRFPAFLSYDLVWDGNEITDERSIYFANSEEEIYLGFIENGFRNTDVGSGFAGRNWYFTGARKVSIETAIGKFGYTKGPNVYVIDREALADPLLARLPTHQKKWRIGHFGRDLPAGYLETLETGVNQIEDP
ncbi:MAG: hypothetical protein L6Q49_18065, partial [Anaerolineales bacterium]|nr:hypothetical protein [Anaerolineales bacterium]